LARFESRFRETDVKLRRSVTAGWWLRATLVFSLLLAACQHVRPPTASSAGTDPWDAHVDGFIESYFTLQPQAAIWAGRHEFDGRLPDLSLAGIRRRVDWLHAERDQAAAFPTASLSPQQRLERENLLSIIDGRLFWLESMDWHTRSPTFYAWALQPDVYVSRPYAPLAQRLRAYIGYARSIPLAAAQIRANLRMPLPRTYVQMGHILFGGLATFYEAEVPGIFAAVQDEASQAELRAANAEAIRAMKELDVWLSSHEPEATDHFRLGAQKFAEMLWATERIDMPLPLLRETAERDLARNLTALGEACSAYAPGQALPACVAKMQARKPAGSPLETARQQLVTLKTFVEQQELVTIPGLDEAQVAETPPYERWNSAQIEIPGPYEKNVPSIYQIAPPDPAWTPAEREAYIPGVADLLFTSAHEVWPGHFLQFLHARQSRSKLGSLFWSYAFSEGWAHYCEELVWEAGLGHGDPETHVGQLVLALLRDVRLVSALGLHTGTMSVEESERLFREKAFQDAGNARQQAARGTFDPEYGDYTLGKLMIRALRDDWSATRGGRAAWHAFHDEFLSYGAPPIALVRRSMMGGDERAGLGLGTVNPALDAHREAGQ
jgi:hypothetical protein